MKVMYIRHNELGSHITSNLLLKDNECEGKIAIYHNREKISRVDKTLTAFMEECSNSNNEHLIVAHYSGHSEILIGISEAKSHIRDYKPIGKPEKWMMESLNLKDVIRIKIEDFPMPFLAAPRGTFVHWDLGKEAVVAYYNARHHPNRLPKITPGLFTPGQLEALCEEWLRVNNKLKRKLFKSGGSMKDYDIVGVDDQGKYVVAQVKFKCPEADVKNFFENNKFDNKYFFTNNSNHELVTSLDEVIDYFNKIDVDKEYLYTLAFGNNREQFRPNP